MNLVLLLFMGGSIKKQVYLAAAVLIILLSLPMMAVFSLGVKTLSILSSGNSSSQSEGLYQGPISASDKYEWGNCTYWVSLLRQQANDPIPNTWGNAETWAMYAKNDGYIVDHSPTPGSIMQLSGVAHNLGHVAYVESVDQVTGAWTISEMNVKGLDIVDTQTLPASKASTYNFIHDKSLHT